MCRGTWVLSAFGCLPGMEWRDPEGILGGGAPPGIQPGVADGSVPGSIPCGGTESPPVFLSVEML